MTLDEMMYLTRQADELGCRNVVLTGGEPTLMKHEDLLRYFHFVKEQTKIALIRIVTNGHWAKNYDKAYQILKEWKDAGLDELNVSCGEYHQEFIPINNVIHAFKAADELKYLTALLAGEFVKGEQATVTPYDFENLLGRKIIQSTELSPFVHRFVGFDCHPAMDVGRGNDHIASGTIPITPYERIKSNCDHLINSLAFQPNGRVDACCGVMVRNHPVLSFGNWREESILDLLQQFHDDLIINWIRYLGVKDMKDWLHRKDRTINFKNEYNNSCDICNEMLCDERCLQIFSEHGMERRDEIILQKTMKEATIFNPNYKYA
jgi:organic radical activating enzyme